MTEKPGYDAQAVLGKISLRRRITHLVLGLTAAACAAVLVLLWSTEPGPLPARTHAAFAALTAINLTWAGFAGWALRRLPMYARDRVIAGRLAAGFSAATTLAAVALMLARPGLATRLGTVVALLSLATALTVLRRARARRAELLALERRLHSTTADPTR